MTASLAPILLVEDNPDDETLTLRALKKNAIVNPVVVLRDGVQVLDYLFGETEHPSPALVLLDLKLPRKSGLEVLEKIRSSSSTTYLPVVILTTSNEPQDIRSAYALGANSYIRKPVDFEEFIEAVGMLGRYWLRLNEAPH